MSRARRYDKKVDPGISSETAGSSREGVCVSTGFFRARSEHPHPLDVHKFLEELCGQPELIHRLLHVFQAEAQKDIDSLEAALNARDIAKVATLAHRLKGSAATIGADSVGTEAAQIERFGQQGNLQLVQDHLSNLRQEFESFCDYVSGLPDWE